MSSSRYRVSMNRRAALALLAVSLTMLPACVTKVVDAPVDSADSSLERLRNSVEIREAFRDSIDVRYQHWNQIERRPFSEDFAKALELCRFFDDGGTSSEWWDIIWPESLGTLPPTADVDLFVTQSAVDVVCPEHYDNWNS